MNNDLDKESVVSYSGNNNKNIVKENELKIECVEITWKRILRIFWDLLWMETVYVILATIIVGIISGILIVTGINKIGITMIASIIITILGVPVSLLILKIVLKKKYSDFKIALIKP